MEKKRVFYAETAYVIGQICTALGVALTERADFGVSMVVAPAYVLYRKVSETLSFFTFGMAEYLLQAVLLLALMLLLRRVRLADLFAFVSALLYGLMLDGIMLFTVRIPTGSFAVRLVLYATGLTVSATGISLMFHTYITPLVYELFTKASAQHFGIEIHRFKTWYDCGSCLLAVLLSFLCFGFGTFVGVRVGTVVCALINGSLIGLCSKLLERHFTFRDALPYRKFFLGEA